MSHAITQRSIAMTLVVVCMSAVARASEPRNATIPPDTKARLTLQSRISSKLSEPGDLVTATLVEPIYVEGELVLQRGTEFLGHIVAITPAKRGQRSSNMSIAFDRVVTSTGLVAISTQVTAIDDWDREESIKANGKGKMKGGHRTDKTIDNMRKGTSLGFSGSLIGALLGGAAGASGRQALGIGGVGMAAGMIGGLLLTKGNEIRAAEGSILRIQFLKAATLPIVRGN